MSKPLPQSEADARVLIDRRLQALGWRNIWRETVPLALQIPLPSLQEQRALVKDLAAAKGRLHRAQDALQNTRTKFEQQLESSDLP